MFKDAPKVADWFERIQARPSYQEAVAADFPDDVMKELGEKGKAVWHKIEVHLGQTLIT